MSGYFILLCNVISLFLPLFFVSLHLIQLICMWYKAGKTILRFRISLLFVLFVSILLDVELKTFAVDVVVDPNPDI